MAKKKNESFFWTSYSDLMTNLFFVMLMLFVLAIALLHKEVVSIGKERDATKAELEKINEIRTAIESIDTTFFEYNEQYKKHILKTKVKFNAQSSDMNDLPDNIKSELMAVKRSIEVFLDRLVAKDKNASYLLIIEGQASKDKYAYNDQLSYDRALALYKFWFPDSNSLTFGNYPCEIVIAGSGCLEGKPWSDINEDNQRFLIQIMPKPGVIGRKHQ